MQRYANLFWLLCVCLVKLNQNDSITLQKTLMFICMQKISFAIHFFLTILHFKFDWLAAFWPINWDPKCCQMCWWNINNNISLYITLFPRKINDKIFQKIHSGPFLSKFGQKWIFLEKRSHYMPLCQKSVNPNEPFLRKLLDRHTKNQFIPLISSWDTASFGVLPLIVKSRNLIGQENFGPYLRNQNFRKYEICSSIPQLQ